MDSILGILILIVFVLGPGFVIYFLRVGFSAASRTVMGKGSFGDNVRLSMNGMGPFEIRTRFVAKNTEDELSFDVIKVEGRGVIPTDKTRTIKFLTSILDKTEEEKKSVWSMVEEFQEEGTLAYQHSMNGGTVSPDQGFASWTQVGAIIPEIVVPARSGERKMMVVEIICKNNQVRPMDIIIMLHYYLRPIP